MTKFFKFSIVVDTDMDEFEAWDKFLDIMDECKAKDVFDCEESLRFFSFKIILFCIIGSKMSPLHIVIE